MKLAKCEECGEGFAPKKQLEHVLSKIDRDVAAVAAEPTAETGDALDAADLPGNPAR